MPMLPLRDLGKVGVVTDVDPYDLPASAFSFAKNVRFEDNKIQRGAVFRKIAQAPTITPKHMFSYVTQTGVPQVFYVANNGTLREFSLQSGENNRSPASYTTPSTNNLPVTSCILNNVVYVNRPDRLPWYRGKDLNGVAFSTLPVLDSGTSQWRTDWRCRVLRSMSGVLIAANITKGANLYPNMVKWSNFSTEPNMVPPDWDFASTVSNAGENTLAEMQGAIIDAFPLRNRMYLYGDAETWMMEFIGGNDMFRFDRTFDRGVLGVNCVAEEGGLHYVFGNNDIWVHDGTGDRRLGTSKVRRFIYDSMRREEAHQFFVTVNRRLNEIIFCYVSDDQFVRFPAVAGKGCNRAAIYNYASETFYFADMPYVTCAAQAALSLGASVTYATATGSYSNVGGSFSQLDLVVRTNLTFGSFEEGTITRSFRTFEDFREVESGFDLDTIANTGAYIERTGIDLDEVGAELRGYKLISSIYPQGRIDDEGAPLEFTFGTSDHPSQTVTWGDSQTFDRTFYKLDFNIAGRYLAMKMEQSDFRPFTLSAMDLDVTLLGLF